MQRGTYDMQIVNPQILIDIQNLHIQIHFQHDVSFMNITNYIHLQNSIQAMYGSNLNN